MRQGQVAINAERHSPVVLCLIKGDGTNLTRTGGINGRGSTTNQKMTLGKEIVFLVGQ